MGSVFFCPWLWFSVGICDWPCGFSSVGLFIASSSLVRESSLFILLPLMSTWASLELLQVKLLWPFPCPSSYTCGLSFLWGTCQGVGPAMEPVCSGYDNLSCHLPKWLYQFAFIPANLRAFWYLSHPQQKGWEWPLCQSRCAIVLPCAFNSHVSNNEGFLAPSHLPTSSHTLSLENLFKAFDFPF